MALLPAAAERVDRYFELPSGLSSRISVFLYGHPYQICIRKARTAGERRDDPRYRLVLFALESTRDLYYCLDK